MSLDVGPLRYEPRAGRLRRLGYSWYSNTVGIRKPKSRAAQTEDNHRRLLDAARTVFVREGYQGATLDQVARHAGLTKGAVYARFDGKAALFLALLEQRIEERTAELAALPTPTSVCDAVESTVRQWLARSQDAAWALLVLEFRVVAARDRQLNARYAALHERLVARIAQRVAEGARASGAVLAQPSEALARIGLSLANGVLLEREVASAAQFGEELVLAANRAMVEAFAPKLACAPRRPR